MKRFQSCHFLIFFCLFFALLSMPQGHTAPLMKKGTVILDDEIQSALSRWVKKIFHVAGLSSYKPEIYIIVDDELNAAASVGGQLVLFSGLILQCDDLSELLGVIAHEVGHIAGGHVSRSDEAMQRATIPAAAAMLLGVIAGAASGSSDAILAGVGGGTHFLNRSMLQYSRMQEHAADQAALTYLDKLHWSPVGLMKLLEKLHRKHNANMTHVDPYTLTHPLTQDRLTLLRGHMERSPLTKSCTLPSVDQERFQRIKAKLAAFLQDPAYVKREYTQKGGIPSSYASAIIAFRQRHYADAIRIMDQLCQAHPKDAYFLELKGQMLFESGNIKVAIPTLRQAVQLLPKAAYIKLLLAHALLESHPERQPYASERSPHSPTLRVYEEAITLLVPVSRQHPNNIMVWRLLASAYGKTRQMGMMSLSLAEEAFYKQDYKVAESHAKRAIRLLSTGSSHQNGLIRARDLLTQIAILGEVKF